MSQRHHDGHGNADAGFHYHLLADIVPLETVALIKSRKDALQRGAKIVALLPGGSVTRRGRENATVLVELDAHQTTVVGDLAAVLLVTFSIALTVQIVDSRRTAILQGLATLFEAATNRHLPLFAALGTHTIHLT